jgi:hypothetical protein
MIPAKVTMPADLESTSRRDLVDALDRHEGTLVDARLGIGTERPVDELRAAALDALAVGRALADRALRWEWLAQVAALEHGATLADVANACGLTPGEVAAGLGSRVAAQVAHAGMSPAEADQILALVAKAR